MQKVKIYKTYKNLWRTGHYGHLRDFLTSCEVEYIISGDWTKPSSKITRTPEKENDEDAKL